MLYSFPGTTNTVVEATLISATSALTPDINEQFYSGMDVQVCSWRLKVVYVMIICCFVLNIV